MVMRTFIQNAQGYGSSPTSIQAKINNVVVFEGNIPTIDAPIPEQPAANLTIQQVIYSWELPVEYAGTQQLEITVSNGSVLLAETLANYPSVWTEDPANTWISPYSYSEGNITISDPLSDETIDGVLQPYTPELPLTGQWWWTIGNGSTFTATINIQAGNIGNVT